MKSGATLLGQDSSADQLATDKRSASSNVSDMRNLRPEPAAVYEIEVHVCRLAESQTRARVANLPLPEKLGLTVREVLQVVVDDARSLINDCLARDNPIPWIDPPALPEENESRFVVPLVL